MPLPVGTPGKGFPAIPAPERFFLVVIPVKTPPVPRVLRPPAEILPALLAPKFFLNKMNPLMFHQRRGVAKTLPAEGTFVGPEPRVSPLVPLEVDDAAEAPPAVRANVRAAPGVAPLVPVKVRTPGKGFPTFGALERFFPRVDPAVAQPVRAPGKAFPALAAPKGQIPRVAPLVSRQFFVPPETLATLVAFITKSGFFWIFFRRFFLLVAPLMAVKVGRDVKTLPATGAAERFFPGVSPAVFGEMGPATENFAAI